MDWSLFLIHNTRPGLFFTTPFTAISCVYSLPSATLFSFLSLFLSVYFTPSSLLLFTTFFFFMFCHLFSVCIFSNLNLEVGEKEKNNNKIPYSFHFLDQRWLSNWGGEFRAAFDAQYWCWLSMKISLCYIWANYQRSTQLTWDTLALCEAKKFKAYGG